jgi:energy-coupling factor transporter ATP-binding protein EcfA2
VNVLQEILSWSESRPAWQRDALRRLVISGELTESDILALTKVCKSAFGLDGPMEYEPLTAQHIPAKRALSLPVSLLSIFHRRGVNALAENQTLKFSGGLTIVYGDNGAGKTGYIRILKSACRARGKENILSNVVSGIAPLTPIVAIRYKVGNEGESTEWVGRSDDEFISRVSVFDTQSASVYLTEKTDIAFRPLGLDLFDKLVKGCKAVRIALESEQRELQSSAMPTVLAHFSDDTAVKKLLIGITSLTKPETVIGLSRMSPEEEERLAILEKSLLDLHANDPTKLMLQLNAQLKRIQALIRHFKSLETVLSAENVNYIFQVRDDVRLKTNDANQLRSNTFPADLLHGTASDQWSSLWESARRFSNEQAYPNEEFPFLGNGANCVLCQQLLENKTTQRLRQFEIYVSSKAELALRLRKEDFEKSLKAFSSLKISNETIEQLIQEIRIEDAAVADLLASALETNETRRMVTELNLDTDTDPSAIRPEFIPVPPELELLAVQIESRIATLNKGSNNDTRNSMSAEAHELRARKTLRLYENVVLEEIERKKMLAAFGLCLEETKTHAISQKSTAVTKVAVSNRLKIAFQEELERLRFNHIEVELKEMGSGEGIFYHKLSLSRAPGVELPNVVSEGEQRCLSVASFFAELSTTDDSSAIVFDDPVSSLDFQWRHAVARRLVEESKVRQVIVFTHDVVFLLALRQIAESMDVEAFDQHVRQLLAGAGVCTEELPWVALPVKKKIGHLLKEWQSAEKLSRDGHKDAYEKEAKNLYGLLREAWERALEEILLGGIVERYRPNIQTRQIGMIADIQAEDCKSVETAMTKCSTWLTGHDQAAAARAPVPAPIELKTDILALEEWVSTIHRRRKQSK